jgi:hypothetical protein
MSKQLASWILSLLVLQMSSAAAQEYILQDDYSGESLFSEFDFFTGPDPTQGFVKYLGEADAREAGLIAVTRGYDGEPIAYMGVDSENETPDGRPSVRISSKTAYHRGLFIADFTHVPGTACGAWPAFWMLGPNWPHGGEIDIYEGINLDIQNSMTLHTGPGCVVEPSLGEYTGVMTSDNCDVNAPDQRANKGCNVMSTNPLSFGKTTNLVGGGVYATEWTEMGISIWFFPRILGIPEDIEAGVPEPELWGLPEAAFAGDGCDFNESFRELNVILDITFCGEWAGNEWKNSLCSLITPKCETFVEKFPGAFRETYWEVKSVKVYELDSEFRGVPQASGS